MLNLIKQLAGIIGGALKFFALLAILVNIAYSILLCLLVLYLAGEQSTLKLILSILIGIFFGCLSGTILAIRFSIARMLKRITVEFAPGQTILKSLFSALIKESGSNISPKKIEKALNSLAKELQPDLGSGSVADLATWLAGQVNRILIWATIKVVVKQATKVSPDGQEVDLILLGDKLGGIIDNLILSYLKGYLSKIAYALFSLLTSFAIYVGYLIGKIAP